MNVPSFISIKVFLSKHLTLGILRLVFTFNTFIINAKIIAIGIEIAINIAVLAIAAPHVNGIIQNIATIVAKVIKIEIINFAIVPIKAFKV